MKDRLHLLLLSVALVAALAACSSGPGPAPAATAVPEVDCTQQEPHPIAQSIAKEFGVTYEQVMAWACAGESFDDILLALQTGEIAQRSPSEVLALKKQTGDWDKVWASLGLGAQPQK